jgi:hypothetical protein
MNPTIQPRMHPDAETLTAFAEQLLPAAEREEILAHMSTCGRCREVVFLAQQAVEEDQPTPAAAAVDKQIRPRSSWFNWGWAWIPVAACAGFIAVAVVQHNRKAGIETQVATNAAPTDSIRTTEAQKAETQKQATQNEPKPIQQAKPSGTIAERESVPQAVKRDDLESRLLDQRKSADRKDVGSRALEPPIAALGITGGSSQGMTSARAKNSAIGGPLANELQQQSMANQQNMQQSPPAAQFDANKPVNAATLARSESETVTVQTQPVLPTQQAAPAPAAAIAPTEESKARRADETYGFIKKEKVSLPNGLETLSVANGGGDRIIALDTKGALFLSEDGGRQWKPVRNQWTGRAVLVRSLDAAEKGKVLSALKAVPTAKFELVTDSLQTWLSTDGNIWTLQTMPGK